MPYTFNQKIRSLKPYDPVEGSYAIRLDANESFLPILPEERALIAGAVAGVNPRRYPDPAAAKLCRAFAACYGVDPAHVTAWNGGDECLHVLADAFLMKGDKLLCFAQDFSMYSFYGHLVEGEAIQLSKRDDFSIDVSVVLEALELHRPAVFVFSNPCNPTSLVLERERVREIIRAAEKQNTLVVLDEAYMDFSNQSLLDEVHEHENLIILRTSSKAAGMAGLRLGFSVAEPLLTNVLRAAKSPYNVGVLTQAVGEAIYGDPARFCAGVESLRASVRALAQGLRALEDRYSARLRVIGGEANFVFVAIPEALAVFEYLKSKSIIVRCFYGRALRITAGSGEENAALLLSLENYLEGKV
ncbi:MAG: aminotransferase class I/II-fold pyridoxal phosphate-dependent enzyme [Oscillospiraceae bacterium]|nr:aminotransferase class I/II-fold pyridoxal phosphate-dependent enzyme [Oscillospiraceae bacterium]